MLFTDRCRRAVPASKKGTNRRAVCVSYNTPSVTYNCGTVPVGQANGTVVFINPSCSTGVVRFLITSWFNVSLVMRDGVTSVRDFRLLEDRL